MSKENKTRFEQCRTTYEQLSKSQHTPIKTGLNRLCKVAEIKVLSFIYDPIVEKISNSIVKGNNLF